MRMVRSRGNWCQLFLRWCLASFIASVPVGKVWAECSPFAGLASINEIVDENNFKFIEVKRLSSSLVWSASDPWEIEFCLANGSCSGTLALPEATEGGSLWLLRYVNKNDIPTLDLQGMDVRLIDKEGRTVDYVRVGNAVSAEDPECPAESADLPFDNELELTGGESGKYARRSPDGTGDWGLGSGASDGKETEQETNDTGVVDGPVIGINNVTVSQGELATFTVSLETPADRDVLIDYQTQDLSALQGQDYEFSEGTLTVPTGQTQITLSVPTLRTGDQVDKQFFVIIGNARDSSGIQYGQLSSQAGVATIEPVVNRLDHFQIDVAAAGSVCAPVEVVVSARDDSNIILDDYIGTIALTTTSGSGNWSEGPSGQLEGVLSPNPDLNNDGQAGYEFVSADNGSISLYLANPTADALRIRVNDPLLGVQSASSVVRFQENGFVIESIDANALDIVAERDHAFVVKAVRRDPVNSSECGLITEYDGQVSVTAWLGRTGDDAGGAAPALDTGLASVSPPDARPGSANLLLEFDAGEAPLTLQTTDVGQYHLSLVDTTSGFVVDEQGTPLPVVGESSIWTVRPDRFGVEITDNPAAATAVGVVFRKAGQAFELIVTALGWQGSPLQSYGAEGNPQGAEITQDLLQPAGESGGTLAGTTTLQGSNFSGGKASVADLSWNEVGIIDLAATNTSYLGISPAIEGRSGPVGRFIPDRFEIVVDPGEMAPFCDATAAFTYSGQPGSWSIAPQLTITAYGPGNYVTTNYTVPGFQKLNATDVQRTEPVTDNTATTVSGLNYPVSVTLEPGSLSAVAPGVMSFEFSGGDRWLYQKSIDSIQAPFTPDLTVRIVNVEDSDGVAASGAASINPVASFEIRYGSLQMQNVYGPETLDELFMPFSAEYWNGSGFVTNIDDSCTPWSTSNIADPEAYHALVADSATLSGGVGGSLVLEPNGDRGTDTLIWEMPIWLEGDWNQDGALEDPSATATFGVFRGNDRIVYWRER
ncbi:MAG: DUF6701 domain-containing protein [Marinobacter sp.]|uniref:DUF6701 domain-containing protein n=1 Tax=Marinobacter sp. TaxID=50741 RepID=UPI00396DDDBF